MEAKHLTYFKVENFKRFDSLEVSDIGQFNLVVGDNNVGKTSFLEALLFDEEKLGNFLSNLNSVLANRKILGLNNDFTIVDLFAKDPKVSMKYFFQYLNYPEQSELKVSKRLRSSLQTEEIDTVSTKLKLYPDLQFIEFSLGTNKYYIFPGELKLITGYYPYIPFTTIYGNDIVDFFSRLAISSSWLENFKTNLREFIPNLITVELSNAITKESIIVLREQDKDLAQPLAQYGDGTIKLFRYLLELEFCENRRLMIDEIDTGIHYSRLKDFLKKVLQTARNKNVQIFATTHSKECLQYYKEALEELGLQDNGRVIKIADTRNGIRAYTSKFAEFENSLFGESEIR